MPREMLFELRAPGEELGRVTAEAAARTGLPAGVPVFATSNDKAVEALGAGLGAIPNPDAGATVLLSLGTYISAMTLSVGPSHGQAYLSNFAARPGMYLAESHGVRRGMWTISWLRRLVQPENSVDETMYNLEALLDAEAADLPAGSDGVVAVLDWLAPPDEPWRRGALLGFSGEQGRAHVYRAILEAIALTMADNVTALANELEFLPTALVVTGGGAQSATMRQILADVFALTVYRAAIDDAAGMGAAVCAAVGAGVHPDWERAIAAMVHIEYSTAPGDDVAVYSRLRGWHSGVRRRVAELSQWAVEQGAAATLVNSNVSEQQR